MCGFRPEPGSRIRVLADPYSSAFAFPHMDGFVGPRFRVSSQKHDSGSAVPRFVGKACPCISGFAGFRALTQPLTSTDERAQLLANGAARAAGHGIDPMPVVRLFMPDAHAIWLLAALGPADDDTAWGLIDLGIGMPALETVKLSDLANIVGPQQRPVLRDLYFHASRPLSEYARLAQRGGSIPD